MKYWLPAALAMVVLMTGCQAIFTYSPLSFLQRDPSKMSLDQRINFAEQALATELGDQRLVSQYRRVVDQHVNAASGGVDFSYGGDCLLFVAHVAESKDGSRFVRRTGGRCIIQCLPIVVERPNACAESR